MLSTQASSLTFSPAAEKAPPFVGQAGCQRAVAAIAVRQARRTCATAQQQTLLALGVQDQGLGAAGWAVRHLGRMPAAAQPMCLTGADQADFGEELLRVIGHGSVARMESGEFARDYSRIASGLRTAPFPIYGRGLGRGFGVG
ncbi:hypothetical protein HN51_14095 [Ectopseudomonas mendocina]|uniref:Uncharacterized protein n=1 Tax=Ectopseudomonas mendocina S5.2 TaxID=1225174 RepID=A0ABN4IRH8_ECTME|nr:hypothetical protein DW68_006180 [Pseudomonas mendocina S5.2]KES00939.1 hypothetical protein HN51_14095 [Pseudomonas mendocina]